MNTRLSETDHHPLGQTGAILAASPSRAEAAGYCHPASDPRDPVRRACSTSCSWSWHHLIRLDYHKNVRSEGTLSNNFIPFRASVWVHVLWLPGKDVCPLSCLMERARRVGATSRGLYLQLSALVIRLRLPRLRYVRFAAIRVQHFPAAIRLSDLSIKIHQLHAHANSLRENHSNLNHQLERTPSTAFRTMGAIGGWCDSRFAGLVTPGRKRQYVSPYEAQVCEF